MPNIMLQSRGDGGKGNLTQAIIRQGLLHPLPHPNDISNFYKSSPHNSILDAKMDMQRYTDPQGWARQLSWQG